MRSRLNTARKPEKIRAWFAERKMTFEGVARNIGVHGSLVHHTVSGRMNNRRVLRALMGLGVPAGILALPDDLRNEHRPSLAERA